MVTYQCFKGLADPVRQSILFFLSQQPLSVAHLAERFEISRPAISRHLKVLRESGLVSEAKTGRQRIYSPRFAMLEEVAEWLRALADDPGRIEERSESVPSASPPPADAGWRQW